MGSSPGYGLLRMVVASDQKRRKILSTGEYKSLASDRVILVPGPREEVECIRRIYDLVLQGKNVTQIAGILNGLGIPYRDGKPWRRYAVEEIVINPKYAGSYVWNKSSQTLGQRCVTNLPESWVVNRDAFAPIIDRKTFDRVQRLRGREKRWSDEQLLDKLKLLLAKKGELSMKLIDTTPGMPCSTTYYRRLGPFRHIYPMVGYSSRPATSQKSDHRERTRVLREGLVRRLVALSPGKVTVFNLVRDARPMLELDNGVRVAIRICTRTTTGRVRWRLYNGISSHRGHVTLLCLLNAKNDAVDKFYVVPGVESVEGEQIITENCSCLAAGLRLDDLQELYGAAMHCAHKTGYTGEQLRLAIDAA